MEIGGKENCIIRNQSTLYNKGKFSNKPCFYLKESESGKIVIEYVRGKTIWFCNNCKYWLKENWDEKIMLTKNYWLKGDFKIVPKWKEKKLKSLCTWCWKMNRQKDKWYCKKCLKLFKKGEKKDEKKNKINE